MTALLTGLIVLLGLAAEEKPTLRELTSPGKDIVVFSDRDEKLPDFFRRQWIATGQVSSKALAAQFKAKEPGPKAFVVYASYNHGPDGKGERGWSSFGANVRIAPVPAPVAKALAGVLDEKKDTRLHVVFRRDSAKLPGGKGEAPVWHVVGYLKGKHDVRFFEQAARKDLLHKDAPK